MKRIIYIVTGIMLSLSLFLSCARTYTPTREVLFNFCERYGIDEYKIYSSDASHGGEGYLDRGLTDTLFFSELPRVSEYSLLLHTKLGSVIEVGVFLTDSAADRLLLYEICEERLSLLENSIGGYQSFAFTEGDVFFYGYLPDAERAVNVLRSLI